MKIKKMLLGVLGVAALIGVGSATWKFAGSASQTANGTIKIADVELVGGVTVAGTLVLNVDDSPSWSNSLVPTYNANGGVMPADMTYNYTIQCTGFDDYLTFGTLTGSWTSGSKMTDPSVSWNSTKKGNPQNKSDYNTMKTALANAKIVVTFTATTANGNTGDKITGTGS